jgi:type II secretory pathway pseudopilin PulG
MKASHLNASRGFSLVEVTLALGLVSFCLLTMMGLLPVGLNAVRSSNNEAMATNCLEQIAGSIRHAVLQTSGTYAGQYQASGTYGGYNTMAWTLGGSKVTANLVNLSASGFPATEPDEQRYATHVEILPPADGFSTGKALISVAWPVQATWDSTTSNWKHAQGSVQTLFIFLPSPSK